VGIIGAINKSHNLILRCDMTIHIKKRIQEAKERDIRYDDDWAMWALQSLEIAINALEQISDDPWVGCEDMKTTGTYVSTYCEDTFSKIMKLEMR
jgi:hypothetical protein